MKGFPSWPSPEGSGDAKANLGTPLFLWGPVSFGGSQILRLVKPRATPHDSPAAIAGCTCRAIRRQTRQSRIPTILYPFPDVILRVKQAERIRRAAIGRN